MTDTLDAGRIAEGLLPALRPRLRRVTVLRSIDSTNAELARLPVAEQHAHAILAETQTAGRGRGARRWHSPPGGNIYLSLGWRLRAPAADLSALPLAVAVAVAETLAAAGLQDAGIKWPNDILADGRKLAGILVESQGHAASGVMVITGVGVNVRMAQTEAAAAADAAIDRPWTDLESQLPAALCPVDRNDLATGLLNRLIAAFEGFERSGFATFRARYEAFDLLSGRPLTLELGAEALRGTGCGIDGSGCLKVALADGDVRAFHSGEVRVFDG